MEEQERLLGDAGPVGHRGGRREPRGPGDLASAMKSGGGLQLSSTPVSLSSPAKMERKQ